MSADIEISQIRKKYLLCLYAQLSKGYSLEKMMCFCHVFVHTYMYIHTHFLYIFIYMVNIKYFQDVLPMQPKVNV